MGQAFTSRASASTVSLMLFARINGQQHVTLGGEAAPIQWVSRHIQELFVSRLYSETTDSKKTALVLILKFFTKYIKYNRHLILSHFFIRYFLDTDYWSQIIKMKAVHNRWYCYNGSLANFFYITGSYKNLKHL